MLWQTIIQIAVSLVVVWTYRLGVEKRFCLEHPIVSDIMVAAAFIVFHLYVNFVRDGIL